MRLIVEHCIDGTVYAYFETEKQFKRNKNYRIARRKVTRTDLDHECAMPEDSYVEVKVQK